MSESDEFVLAEMRSADGVVYWFAPRDPKPEFMRLNLLRFGSDMAYRQEVRARVEKACEKTLATAARWCAKNYGPPTDHGSIWGKGVGKTDPNPAFEEFAESMTLPAIYSRSKEFAASFKMAFPVVSVKDQGGKK